MTEAHRLLHGGESRVRGDPDIRESMEENRSREVDWQVEAGARNWTLGARWREKQGISAGQS